ncbi:hypothetical protein MRB53_038835 [Persea americana]|nr:hypothetical protein MRB53_038835 [Persea americana]
MQGVVRHTACGLGRPLRNHQRGGFFVTLPVFVHLRAYSRIIHCQTGRHTAGYEAQSAISSGEEASPCHGEYPSPSSVSDD